MPDASRQLTFSWGGNPGVGSLQRFRDAVENGWPHPLEIEEHSHAGMATRYAAGAAGLPFGVLRGYVGTDLAERTSHDQADRRARSPASVLTAVPAINPDVGIIHAQRADRDGNVQIWGLLGVQKEAVLASTRSIVTVEEIVDELAAAPGAIVLPSGWSDAVCQVPGGAHPSFAMGYSGARQRLLQGVGRDLEATASASRRGSTST